MAYQNMVVQAAKAFEAANTFRSPYTGKDPFNGMFERNSPTASLLELARYNGLVLWFECSDERVAEIAPKTNIALTTLKCFLGFGEDSLLKRLREDNLPNSSSSVSIYKRHDTGLFHFGILNGAFLWDRGGNFLSADNQRMGMTDQAMCCQLYKDFITYSTHNPNAKESVLATIQGRELSGITRYVTRKFWEILAPK